MQNGYFQLVSVPGGGHGLRIYPPLEDGKRADIAEIVTYLDTHDFTYDIVELKRHVESDTDTAFYLGQGECPVVNETYYLSISEDSMLAVVRFYAPSENGSRMSFNEFLTDLRYRNITSGIQMSEIQDHFQSPGIYCTDITVAKGKAPRHGTDARIEYYFNTDIRVQPTMNDDGSVDYFHLNVINHCRKGDLLARIIPADEGEYGMNIVGNRIKPRDVRKVSLKYGHHVELSEDRLSITSQVDGHVMLVEDKVFVSDVYEVENVDISTGNIEFNGSVQVNGNVASNYTIRSNGNVVINGVVEGAHIIATGNIIIARGMNGMAKGTLQAGGNIVAKFIESAKVIAEKGYVNTESILHSEVSAGDEIVVNGKKGFVSGGHVRAANRVSVKTLGAEMGAPTVVEVGADPKLKEQYIQLQKEITELVREIKNMQPVLNNFAQKRAKGVRFSAEQLQYVKDIAQSMAEKKQELEKRNVEFQEIQQIFNAQRKAVVEVTGVVYPGTTIVIGDVSMVVQSSYKYCRFERQQGEVKMAPL